MFIDLFISRGNEGSRGEGVCACFNVVILTLSTWLTVLYAYSYLYSFFLSVLLFFFEAGDAFACFILSFVIFNVVLLMVLN